jgi:hypothetical protein
MQPRKRSCGRRFTNVMENPAPKDASKASVQGSTGVVTGRGMCEEKRKDEPIFHSRHLELGRPGMCTCGSREATKGQCRSTPRRRRWIFRESDPPIVVRDGNTGHTAKEWAGWQRKQSTHHGTCRSRQRCQAPCLHWEPDQTLCVGTGSVCASS